MDILDLVRNAGGNARRSTVALSPMRYRSRMRKIVTAMLALALSSLPFGATAAEQPSPCTSNTAVQTFHGPPPDMAQMHAQMQQLNVAMRTAMLGAISPAHRTMLAQTVGNLA